jgi:hypothetical protein
MDFRVGNADMKSAHGKLEETWEPSRELLACQAVLHRSWAHLFLLISSLAATP